jgi:hypothetical protein
MLGKRGEKVNFSKIKENSIEKLIRKLNIWILLFIFPILLFSLFISASFETIDSMDDASQWSTSDATTLAKSQETTIKTEGTGSIKIISSDELSTETFTSSGTFDVPAGVNTLDAVLIVAGGGGGGCGGPSGSSRGAGGGGAGGLRYLTDVAVTPESGISVTVGGGGSGSSASGTRGSSGGSSAFGAYSATGGGGGGTTWSGDGTNGDGGNGGSGGGAGNNGNQVSSGGSGTSGQGNSGGSQTTTSGRGGAGGGGAGGSGGYDGENGGPGGSGATYWGTTYARGGAGGDRSGGSNGASGSSNTGNGGEGGEGDGSGNGGNGGSGIVIIKYTETSLNARVTRDFGVGNEIDLLDINEIKFDIRSNRTGTYMQFGFGESSWNSTNVSDITVSSANTWETKTIDISGISNSDKDAVRYLGFKVTNADSDFTMYIDNITYVEEGVDGSPCIEDIDCLSGYCDNDGVGLADDDHCFTPYNTYFDGEENTYCEYSTSAITTIYSDEREVGDEIEMCTETGESYFADIVSSVCELEDDTSTCRSSAYAAGCNASADCNNVAPNTCSGSLGYCNVCTFEAPDSSRNACDCSVGSVCDGKTCYNTSWTFEAVTGDCCGDDANEYFVISDYHESIEGAISDTEACCYYSDSCVHDGLCYQHGSESDIDVNLDGSNDFCEFGIWYDCNSTIGCQDGYSCIANDCINDTIAITINNLGQTGFEQTNNEYTSSRSVVLELNFNKSMSNNCRYSNDMVTWTPWETCQTFKFWYLTTGEGLKTVYYNVNKTDGNQTIVNDTIYFEPEGKYLDVTAPSYPTISDEGDYTNSDDSLYASWTGANDPELFFTGTSLRYEYKIYDNTSEVNLSDTWTSAGTNIYVNATGLNLTHNHTYTFIVRVSNSANLTDNSMSDGIIVDLISPNITLSCSHNEDEWSNNNTVFFNWSATENTIEGYSYTTDNSLSTVPDNILETDSNSLTKEIKSDGKYYFHIKAKDLAGNFGPTIHYGYIGIDTTSPQIPVINNPQRFAESENLTFSWTAYDSGSGIVNVSLNVTEVNGSTIFKRWLGNVTAYNITNATINRSYFATIIVKDGVNLTRQSQTIIDVNAPEILFSKPNGNIKNKPIIVIKTDEQAICSFNGINFEYTNSTYHETLFNDINDGSQQISIKCTDLVGYSRIEDINFNLLTGQTASYLNLLSSGPFFVNLPINISINTDIGEIRKNEFNVYINDKINEDYTIVDLGNGNYSLLFTVDEPGNYDINVSVHGIMTSTTAYVNNLMLTMNYSENVSTRNLSRLTYGEAEGYSIGFASDSKNPNVKSSDNILMLDSEFDGKSYIFVTKTDRYLYNKILGLEKKEFYDNDKSFGYRNYNNEYKIFTDHNNILIKEMEKRLTGRKSVIMRNMGLNSNNKSQINISIKNE